MTIAHLISPFRNMMRWLFILFTCICGLCHGGGIRGVIKGDDGSALVYATIFVKQLGTGAASDFNGKYEIFLNSGTYDVIFQYLGYESQARKIEVGNDFIEVNITLKTQIVVLQNVTVRAGKEDPAYTIMRKAIAKAKFHVQQIDEYTAKVYIKGKGKLIDYPWLAKKALEKGGITKDRLFISESVSEIKYTRPNKFEEKVIAVYTNGKDNDTSPNGYVFGSFYQPEIAETVSPLSPKSFSYYRFEYLGSFKDRNYEVSKIKVTPRSKGDNVFDGVIYIVEDWWSIHSLNLHVVKLGIDFRVKQIYNPIEDKAWLPVSQQFQADGKVFGFEFEYNYLATVKDYKIKLNPDLVVEEIKIIDEKLEKEEAKKANSFSKKGQQLQERLTQGKEITNKELKQLVKEYEKQELKEEKEPDVLSNTTYKVDSLAYKKDSVFWSEIRPTPLSKEEMRGYHVNDSISEIERKKEEGDTLSNGKRKNKKGFQPWYLIIGNSYKITTTSDFRIHTPYGGFNTVEGFNIIYRTSFYKRWIKKDTVDKKNTRTSRLEISPIARYAIAREKLTGMLRMEYRTKESRITLEGGRYVQQYNSDNPIHHFVNTFTSLVLGDNLMKIYERDFIDLNLRKRFNDKYLIKTSWSWANRRELFNNTSYTLFKTNKEDYTPNAPVNNELANTNFQENKAFIGSVGVEARPWQKYRIRNGWKTRIQNSSPIITLDYRKGFSDIFGSKVDFDQMEAGIRQQLKIGIRGVLDIAIKGGAFLNTSKMYFMDYKHFLGNRTPFITTDPIGSFRLLDYYNYSTNNNYLIVNSHYHFRKFLVTRIPYIRLMGVTENVFINCLATPASGNYTELGYGLEGILRIFRLEGAISFSNGNFSHLGYGFRIGIAGSVISNFND